MWRGPDATGQQALVSEAVRGEGAVLYDAAGERVMAGVHPLEDLAPRDVVADAISRRMAEAPAGVGDHVYIDGTHLGERFATRFPSITAAAAELGLDPARDRIPVAPAAHYACGGIEATLNGTTSLPGFFAVGEVSATGIHGANRLASNSLTESIVAGTRVGRDLAWELPDRVEPDDEHGASQSGGLLDPRDLVGVRSVMSREVGVLRSADSLLAAASALQDLAERLDDAVPPGRASWEATNLLTVASAVVAAAANRTESRGCHRRTDHPEPDDAWRRHVGVLLDVDGHIAVDDPGAFVH
jgi:aspartate oxidase